MEGFKFIVKKEVINENNMFDEVECIQIETVSFMQFCALVQTLGELCNNDTVKNALNSLNLNDCNIEFKNKSNWKDLTLIKFITSPCETREELFDNNNVKNKKTLLKSIVAIHNKYSRIIYGNAKSYNIQRFIDYFKNERYSKLFLESYKSCLFIDYNICKETVEYSEDPILNFKFDAELKHTFLTYLHELCDSDSYCVNTNDTSVNALSVLKSNQEIINQMRKGIRTMVGKGYALGGPVFNAIESEMLYIKNKTM